MTTIPTKVFVRCFTLHSGKRGLTGLLSLFNPSTRDLHFQNGRFQGGHLRSGRLCCVKKMYNNFAENSMKKSDFAGKGHDIIFRQVRCISLEKILTSFWSVYKNICQWSLDIFCCHNLNKCEASH